MTASSDTLTNVSQLLGELIQEHNIDPDLSLLDTGKLTSLTSMNLILAIESFYCIRIPNHEMTRENLATLRSLAVMVDRVRAQS